MSGDPGLCGSCRWSRRVTGRRGAVYWLCGRSRTDARFAKYPRTPVADCRGYEVVGERGPSDDPYNGRTVEAECEVSEQRQLVVTVIGEDKPGLVELLAETIAEQEGNWLESRLAHLAGKFAGVVRISVPPEHAERLQEALAGLRARGLTVVAEPGSADAGRFREVRLELVGADHPGIVREISTVLARRRVNVEELDTGCFDAPMSGQTLFRANARLQLPVEVSIARLREDLEAVAGDVMVEISLAEVD